ncbi:heavy metal translocating P-type ATPase [Pseudarthrobacter chlorophenolicus A6]|uniref:Heavy metal translocating P-type ATPase n=1 Tax=Pseudarthrobacter chlorophenolicus (strain ATCC 700700 / DSM 12829 / CIP 107037 / JCM 12360 / KCTC 9906 / NCIMB 13794 / A6) TaxID=452863 RepID=B8H9I3_PSECP|nr:heavy metal translocating P-type ATPase [Pseudarthrobacter chlorophenolicus A6]SDQ88756.1 heavy metal-(Cd/Co/Hg/Pb/Zn)-translocating P-type ATPase [Pseudarthrobacter chlorophenolicus]
MMPRGRTLPKGQPTPPGVIAGPGTAGDSPAPGDPLLARMQARVRLYPLVFLTCLVLAATLGLLLAGREEPARLGASAYAALVAMFRAVAMIRSLREGRWGIDVLALMAIASTVAVGEYLAALVVILMLAGGEALETFAQGRAVRELRSLLDRAPRYAHRETDGSILEDTPIGEVLPGDILVVRPSELVPVDSELLSAAASMDESSLTGESLPVERVRGDLLLSGSVNGEAAIRVRAAATAADSQYSRIIALVEEASSSRAPVVRLADRYAVPFTALAVAMAATAWILSSDPVRFAQVLVVATPCPLLIAAPVAFLAGTSQAARKGIIIKNTGTLEQLARARTAVFDKTGTLTSGRPVLDTVQAAPAAGSGAGPAFDPARILQLAASAEQYSSHVLAASVIEAAAKRNLELLPVTEATEHATHGVQAVCGGDTVVVGKAGLVKAAAGFRDASIRSGQLAVHVAINGTYAGALIMKDPLRDNAVETLGQLQRLGVRHTVLLTGDAGATAAHIAREAGITRVQADCLPEDKVQAVAAVRERPVIMVGDGVNDAPVLAAADVGIAMGAKGATAASESADVVVMLDDLSRVALAVAIGQRTMSVALVSIWTGIGLSVGLMAVAMTGYIPAVTGALLQELVDLATILNGLRALRGATVRPSTPA